MSLNFDTNAWYQVNVTSQKDQCFHGTPLYEDGLTGAVFFQNTNTSNTGQRWQFYPYNSSVYLLRCEEGGPNGYLGTSLGTGSDKDRLTGNTVPWLAHYNVSDDSMFWTIEPWGDGTYYFSNLANGTGWRLDTLVTALMAMNSNITSAQRGEQYTFTSIGVIDDSRYSTANTYPSSHTAAPTLATITTADGASSTSGSSKSASSSITLVTASPSPSSGLSTGAAAGIGVGVGIAAVILAGVAGFFLMRRRKNRRRAPDLMQTPPRALVQEDKSNWGYDGAHELSTPIIAAEMAASAEPRSTPVEMPADYAVMLDNTPSRGGYGRG
ncbi:hypothetical protein M406DRAFT_328397 [Cryphonectria parasitica EP155]|uniref:Ricin B lectin domain-containing protein n=1 Tax=Cryphonectria parasitica (strain ATCC 38755 / EP155) TaxID=660469 RepID=A0A9P4Y6E9_CRYP1|nr:uncharacterized protein M406DRAFT_328397 [Cryphonectria parasitica EP155]KAF3767309.1 hypothetical protein M406DRAFT_328397 [Cryphonectria parasitica EP155]